SGSMLQTMPNDGRVPKLWAIGVDLAEHHLGPLHFVAALLDVDTSDSAVGIHVMLGPEFLDPLMAGSERLELRARVLVDVDQMLTRAEVERFTVDLVEDASIDRALADTAARLQADALVVGRRAKRDEDSLVRLGEVTRRLLRRLPVPVVVVPPDFGEPS